MLSLFCEGKSLLNIKIMLYSHFPLEKWVHRTLWDQGVLPLSPFPLWVTVYSIFVQINEEIVALLDGLQKAMKSQAESRLAEEKRQEQEGSEVSCGARHLMFYFHSPIVSCEIRMFWFNLSQRVVFGLSSTWKPRRPINKGAVGCGQVSVVLIEWNTTIRAVQGTMCLQAFAPHGGEIAWLSLRR